MTPTPESGEAVLGAAARWLQDEIDREIAMVDEGEADDLSPEAKKMVGAQVALLPVVAAVRVREARQRREGGGDDEVEKILQVLKGIIAKERTVQLFDPTILADGFALTGMYLDKGDRSFEAYVDTMVAALGDRVKPYLRSCYEAARHYPEFDSTGMSDDATCARAFARLLEQ